MGQNDTPGATALSGKQERAALLVAADDKPDEAIAEEVGIGRMTLHRWKQEPVFQAQVAEHVAAMRAAVRQQGIAVAENRVAALQDRWERMRRVIAERAEDLDGEIPGGGTGLLTRDVKGIGRGADFREVEIYRVDTGLLRELREHEKQAAQELGQWVDRADTTSGGKPVGVLGIDVFLSNARQGDEGEPAATEPAPGTDAGLAE